MRIAHCISSLSGGGAERQLSYLAPELAKKGIETHIIYLTDGPTPPGLSGSGVITHKLNHYNNYDPRIIWGLLKKIIEIKPDIIQSWIVQMDVLAALVSRITRTPWIFREANSEEAAQFRGRKEKVRQLVSRWAKCIVSNSESGFNYWRKIKPTGNIRVIENGIPPEVLSYHKEAGLLQGESRKNIIFAGRLKDHKNIETLLLAFSLCEFDDSLHLLICGTGKHEDYLRSLAKSLNIINQVEFLGHVEQDVLLALMSHALLFVNPSTYEGCPNTVLEAMACMCPVAVSEIPAHKTVLDNESGFFFEPMDYEMLSRILIQVKTPDSMKSKANKARALVENYTIDRMTERYVRLYNDVLQ